LEISGDLDLMIIHLAVTKAVRSVIPDDNGYSGEIILLFDKSAAVALRSKILLRCGTLPANTPFALGGTKSAMLIYSPLNLTNAFQSLLAVFGCPKFFQIYNRMDLLSLFLGLVKAAFMFRFRRFSLSLRSPRSYQAQAIFRAGDCR
jgi:hypothetical protein